MITSENEQKKTAFTLRAILVATGLLIYIALGGPGNFGGYFLTEGCLLALFLLVGVANPILRRTKIPPFSRAELAFIWTTIVIAGMTLGTVYYLLPQMIAPTYFTVFENRWSDFSAGLPSSLLVADASAAHGFYLGNTIGVPWRLWAPPFVLWLGLLVPLFVGMLCIASLFRRQWVDRERLTFPFGQIPLWVISGEAPSGGLWRNPLWWTGFAGAACFHTLNNLAGWYPSLQGFPQSVYLPPSSGSAVWSQVGGVWCFFTPAYLGLAYLLPREVLLSLPFALLYYRLQLYVMALTGNGAQSMVGYSGGQFWAYQEMGAAIAGIGVILYLSRRHLQRASAIAFGHAAHTEDQHELLSYRVTFLLLILSMFACALWFQCIGGGWALGLAVVIVFLATMTTVSWIASCGGVLGYQNSFTPMDVIAATTGTTYLSASTLLALRIPQQVVMYDLRHLPMPLLPALAELSRKSGASVRGTGVAMFGAFIASLLLGSVMYLVNCYGSDTRHVNTGFFMTTSPQLVMDAVQNMLQSPSRTNWTTLVAMASGAGAFILTVMLRMRFLWWPIHPLGFLMAGTWANQVFWFSLAVMWIVKGLILRYGGRKLYLYLLPGFLGLLLGQMVAGGVWNIINYLTHTEGRSLWGS